jgi:hypothetical protein
MIHHLSIGAREPERVAGVFAELFEGMCIPFPPIPGGYLAVAADGHGTGVEVYPDDTAIRPGGPAGAACGRTGQPAGFWAVHFALSVDCGLDRIEAIARREGWDCHVCSRGGDFDVVELWIENRFMVELLPPDFAATYLRFAGRFTAARDAAVLMASHEARVPT